MDAPSPGFRPNGCIGSLAIVAAAAIVSAAIALANGLLPAFPLVMGVTMIVAYAIGFPIFAILRRRISVSPRSVIKSGVVAGTAVPLSLIPLLAGQFIAGGATTSENPVNASLVFLAFVGGYGLAGIIGALITWGFVGWLSSARISQTNRAIRAAMLMLLIAGAMAGSTRVPDLVADHSCHNPMRDGRSSIGPVAGFELHVPFGDWPALSGELANFARARRWSFRDTIPFDQQMPWFDASLCIEPGTLVETTYLPETTSSVIFTVYQPQGGASWKGPVEALQRRLEHRWPGKIAYRSGPYGEPAPPWSIGPTNQKSLEERKLAPGDHTGGQR
jgi:hypothetical protein